MSSPRRHRGVDPPAVGAAPGREGVMKRAQVGAADRNMTRWTVVGAYLARRGYWQTFTKRLEAADAESARAHALSQIGGSHRVPRARIRIDSVVEARP